MASFDLGQIKTLQVDSGVDNDTLHLHVKFFSIIYIMKLCQIVNVAMWLTCRSLS